jgi:hypothetical protein
MFRQLDSRVEGTNQAIFYDACYRQWLSAQSAKVRLDR